MAAMMPRSRAHAGPLRSEADRPSSRRTISTNKAGLVYTRLFRFNGKKVVWCTACFILGVFLPTLFPGYISRSKAPAASRRSVYDAHTLMDDTPCGKLGMLPTTAYDEWPIKRRDGRISKNGIPKITMSSTEYVEVLKHDSDPINLLEMPRVRWREGMSLYDLYEKHRGRAFIVEGALDDHPFIAEGKTIASLGKMCKGGYLHSFVVPDGSGVANESLEEWAGHVDLKLIETSEFVREYVLDDGIKREDRRYAHPMMGAHFWCPSLMDNIRFPAFLGERWCGHSDTLESSGKLTLGQPEAFLGTKGTRSKMHMDNGLIPFWMLLYDGVKRFRVIHSDQYLGPQLRPLFESMALSKDKGYTKSVSAIHRVQPDDGTPAVFCSEKSNHKFDPFKPNLSLFPEFTNVEIYEGTLRRGDAIYLPSATLHGVVNDEASFGLSSNEILPQAFEHALDACLLFPHFKSGDEKFLKGRFSSFAPDFSCPEFLSLYIDNVLHAGQPDDEGDDATSAHESQWEKYEAEVQAKLAAELSEKGEGGGTEEKEFVCKDAFNRLEKLAYARKFEEIGGMTRYKALKADFMQCFREQVPCVKKNGWKFERGSAYKFKDTSFLEMQGFRGGVDEFCAPFAFRQQEKDNAAIHLVWNYIDFLPMALIQALSHREKDAITASCEEECTGGKGGWFGMRMKRPASAHCSRLNFEICEERKRKEFKAKIIDAVIDGIEEQCKNLLR